MIYLFILVVLNDYELCMKLKIDDMENNCCDLWVYKNDLGKEFLLFMKMISCLGMYCKFVFLIENF